MLAVEILLADPETLDEDVLESCLYLCATKCADALPVERVEIGGNVSGPDGLLGPVRVSGENSMPGNRWPGPSARGGVPGGPRDMAKAKLPESQLPEGTGTTYRKCT
jgi:hypothetical protein